MWLGEQITVRGVGNGISIIIFGGILSSIPSSLTQYYQQRFVGAEDTTMAILEAIGIIIGMIILTAISVFFLQAIRKIPIQYAKEQQQIV